MPSSDNDENSVLKVLRSREAAVAEGVAESFISHFADDAVLYDLPPPLQVQSDRAEGVDALNRWFATWNGRVESLVPEPTIIIDGDLALVFGLANLRGDKKGEGPQSMWLRSTVAMRREGDRWKIVHEHSSFPLKMDGSGLAARDLRP